jgi:translation elongation factor EF-G
MEAVAQLETSPSSSSDKESEDHSLYRMGGSYTRAPEQQLEAEADRRANTKQPQSELQQCIKVAVMSKYSPQLQSELVGNDDSNENSTVDTMLKA